MPPIISFNPFSTYIAGAFKAAIIAHFINGPITEQQIDSAKELLSTTRTAEIDQSPLIPSQKEDLKRQLKQWLEITTQGIKDELKAEGRL